MKKLPDKVYIERLTGKEWSARSVEEYVFLNLETEVDDPTIPALFEAFSRLTGAEIWKEKDQQYSLATTHHLWVMEDDKSFISMVGWLQSLKKFYKDKKTFLDYGRKHRLPRFDNLDVRVIRGGPRSLLEENLDFLKDAFFRAAVGIRSGSKDLNIFKAGHKPDELPSLEP
jgi:hypothetical protein